MSYALKVVGRDKDKLKAALLAQVQNEHRRYGIPPHVVVRAQDMIDEVVLLLGHTIEVEINGHAGTHSVHETLRVGLVHLAD